MLKPAWYLITDRDYWIETAAIRRPTPMRQLVGELHRLFSDEAEFTPAFTTTATDILLQAAAYLCDAVRHGRATVPDHAALLRHLHGTNLLLAYTAQTLGRVADQVAAGTGANLSLLTPTDRAAVARTLATATSQLEQAADLIKHADQAARPRPEVR